MSTERVPVKASHRLFLAVLAVVGLIWLAACVVLTIGDPTSAQFTVPGGAMAALVTYAAVNGVFGRSWAPGGTTDTDASNHDPE